MAKFYGIIGFAVSEETRPGVWTESVKERTYRGDLTRTASRWEGTETLNDNVNITNQISSPRLNLTVGGVYNGPTA